MAIKTYKNYYLAMWLLIYFLLPTPNISWCQTGTVRGIIKEHQELLGYVNISIGSNYTYTDSIGVFEMDLPYGVYTIECSHIGYESYGSSIELNSLSPNINLEILLTPKNNLLEELVVRSNKFEKNINESAATIEILKPSFIKKVNASSIDKALDNVPGVNMVGRHANIRGGAGFAFFGIGSRVLLLIDDLPILQPDGGMPNWNDVPLENVGQVEVTKGPSALYGSSALNGVINIQTAFPKTKKETSLTQSYQTYLAPKDQSKKWWGDSNAPTNYNLSFNHREKIKKLDLVFGGLYLKELGYNEGVSNLYGRLNLKTRYRFSDRFTVSLSTNTNKGRENSFFFWADGKESAYKASESTVVESEYSRIYIDPTITFFSKKNVRHKLLSRFYYSNNTINDDIINNSDFKYFEYQVKGKIKKIDAEGIIGIVGKWENTNTSLYGDTTYSGRNLAIYGQLNRTFAQKLKLSTGLRYEQNQIQNNNLIVENQVDSKILFSTGLNYQLLKATYLRSSYGQSYRFPTIAEKFISSNINGLPVAPNLELIPESGKNIEFGIRQAFSILNNHISIDLVRFWSSYENMIEFNFNSNLFSFQAINTEDAVIKGTEFSLRGFTKLGNDCDISYLVGYTFIDPKYRNFSESVKAQSSVDYNILKYRFKHTIKSDFEIGFKKKFFLGLNLKQNSHMEAIDNLFELLITDVQEYRQNNNTGFMTLDTRIRYTFQNLSVSLLLNNVFNEEYTIRPAFMGAPRNISVRIGYQF